jgi:hypothetical protein
VGSGSTPFATQRNVNSGAYAMIQGKMGDSASTSAGHVYSALVAGIEDNTNGAEDGFFAVEVSEGGSSSEKLRVTSSGALGLGTTSPSVALHTVGKVRAQKSGQTSAYVQLSADDVTSNYAADIFVNDTGLTFKHNSNGRGFVFDQNGTERMRITSAGKVGINTQSPTGLLEISGGDGAGTLNIVSTTNSSGSGNKIAFFAANRSDTDEEMAFIKPLLTSNSGGSGNVQTGQLTFGTSGSERGRFDAAGNLGLGTTSPTDKLEIAAANSQVRLTDTDDSKFLQFSYSGGKLITRNNSTSTEVNQFTLTEDGKFGLGTVNPDCKLNIVDASTPIVRIKDTTNNCQLQLYAQNSDAHIGTSSNHPLIVDTNDTERLRLDSNGNFLFATTSSSTNANGIRFFPTGSSGGCFAEFYNGDDGQAVNIGRNSNGTVTNFINGSSTVGSIALASGTTYNTSSDARLKDVTGKARGLEVIGQLNPVAYNWKESGQADEGLIAQEIEELVPNAVNQDEDGYYQMDYSKLVVHLIKAVQEQQEQIESLTSEIANLKGG